MFRDWVKSVRRFGPLYIAAFLFDLVRIHRSEQAEGFDARCGTDTATVVYPWNIPSIAHEHTPEIHAYHAAPAWLIRETLNSIPLQANLFTFIDMGSGKGRALLVASEFPFAKIVGVEISREAESRNRTSCAVDQCPSGARHSLYIVRMPPIIRLSQSRWYCFSLTPLGENPFGKCWPIWKPPSSHHLAKLILSISTLGLRSWCGTRPFFERSETVVPGSGLGAGM